MVLTEVTTREAADALKGAMVFVDQADLPALKGGELWAFKVVGFNVVDEQGAPLGVVEDVTGGVAHDFLVIRTARGSHEVPLVEALVVKMDEAARTVTLRPIPGLLDDEEDESPDAGPATK